MSRITQAQEKAIADLLSQTILAPGGGYNEPCSLGAINLALTGDRGQIPDGMSTIIAQYIMVVQDNISGKVRNSQRWKSLLPLVAGTDMEHEDQRHALLTGHLSWFFSELHGPFADQHGYGDEWRELCRSRSREPMDVVCEKVKASKEIALQKMKRSEFYYGSEWVMAQIEYSILTEAYHVAVNLWDAGERKEISYTLHPLRRLSHLAVGNRAYSRLPLARIEAGEMDEEELCAAHNVQDLKALQEYQEKMMKDAMDIRKAWELFDPCGVLERMIKIEQSPS